MGVEPAWTGVGRVNNIESIPLDDLDQPRIDATACISGLFRDTSP